MSDAGRMEALLVGIDAGCRSVFDRLDETDSIPNIRSIIDEGVSGPLESQIPPWTPSAWPSMYTGVNPGKHGVYGFVHFEGYDWEVVTADHVREHALWRLLDDRGLTSVVVNVPVTHPPDEIDGAVVPGFIGPEDPECHPPGLLEEIREAIGEYRVYPNYVRGDESLTDDEKMDEYCRLAEMRGEAFRYLAGRFEPDFGFVQFQKTDTVFHEFGGDDECVRRIYEATDEQIGRILDRCDPRRVFIASDHGMGRYDGYEFRVNRFLQEGGWLDVGTGGKGMPSWNPIRDNLRGGDTERTYTPGLAARLTAYLGHLGISPSRVVSKLERVGLADIVRRHAPADVVRAGSEQVEFADSRAYMRARIELGVRINLEGREPNGVVPPDEYEETRENLMEALRGVTTPDGEAVFGTVAPREEYFRGPFADDAVDVVTVPNGFDQFLSAQPLQDRFGAPTEPWSHKLDGVFAAAGEGIDSDAGVDDAHLFDVAPTILAALDVPRSDRMDGRVLPIVEDSGVAEYPAYGEAVEGASVEPDVEDRLADLGYLG